MHTFRKTDKKGVQSSSNLYWELFHSFKGFKHYSSSPNSTEGQPTRLLLKEDQINKLNDPLTKNNKKVSFVNIRFIGVGFRGYIVTKKHASLKSIGLATNDVSHNVPAPKGMGGRGGKKLNRFITSNSHVRFLMLKVGQSALTAYPIPGSIEVFCPKDQQADKQAILLIGENLQELKQVVAEIKSYKKPDPYKGSGIYETQRIETEEGEIFKDEIVFRKVMKKK